MPMTFFYFKKFFAFKHFFAWIRILNRLDLELVNPDPKNILNSLSGARNYRPCFHENWVYKFGHGSLFNHQRNAKWHQTILRVRSCGELDMIVLYSKTAYFRENFIRLCHFLRGKSHITVSTQGTSGGQYSIYNFVSTLLYTTVHTTHALKSTEKRQAGRRHMCCVVLFFLPVGQHR